MLIRTVLYELFKIEKIYRITYKCIWSTEVIQSAPRRETIRRYISAKMGVYINTMEKSIVKIIKDNKG
jgi:hypothetical protein